MKATVLRAPDSNNDIFCSSPHLLLDNKNNKEKAETLVLTVISIFQFIANRAVLLLNTQDFLSVLLLETYCIWFIAFL